MTRLHPRRLRIALLTALFIAAPLDARGQVLVDAVEQGGGMLRNRSNECFVITPAHVVARALPGFTVRGVGGATSTGEVVRVLDSDLAIVRLQPGGAVVCDDWIGPGDLAFALKTPSGALVLREAGGSRSLIPVTVRRVEEEFVTVVASRPEDRLRRGMSGGLLLLNGAEAGLLLSVDSAGTGRVIRLDQIVRLTDAFFGPASSQPSTTRIVDLDAAQSIIARAVQAKDGSLQGQGEALAAMVTRGYKFTGVEWNGLSLRGATISRGVFAGAKLNAVDLTEAVAQEADFSEGEFALATWERGRLERANLARVVAPFVAARGAVLVGADLSRANLLGADLRDADLRNANLRGAGLALADLRGAKLDGADLSGASLYAAMLDRATFVGATLRETDLLAATADEFLLAAAQRAGACRRDARMGWPDGFRIFLNENLQGFKPPGLPGQYRNGIRQTAYSAELGVVDQDRSLRRCAQPYDSTAKYFSVAGGAYLITLDRDYLERAGRRAAFERRLADHLRAVEASRLPARTFRGDSAEAYRWTAELRAAARRTRPSGAAYANFDLVLLTLLRAGQIKPGDIDWDRAAKAHHATELSIANRKQEGGAAPNTMWPSLYPAGVPWEELPAERSERYREWTLARMSATPSTLVLETVMAYQGRPPNPPNGPVSLREMHRFLIPSGERIFRNLGNEGRRHSTMSFASWGEGRVLPNIKYVIFAWPSAIDSLKLAVPFDVLYDRSSRLEIEVRVENVSRPAPVEGDTTLVIHVTPLRGRVMQAGRVAWIGPVIVAGGNTTAPSLRSISPDSGQAAKR